MSTVGALGICIDCDYLADYCKCETETTSGYESE